MRYGGVDVLTDPGTYCYHGEEAWRRYFRSTLAHNTIEIAGEDQSVSGGPFLWLASARTTGDEIGYDGDGRPVRWSAAHDGHLRLTPSVRHQRSVARHCLRMAFQLGPAVEADLDCTIARLSFRVDGERASAGFELPGELTWTVHRGETDPILGWYSGSFGTKEPSVTLLGEGHYVPGSRELKSSITFSG